MANISEEDKKLSLEQTLLEIERLKTYLKITQTKVENLKSLIEWMEGSKFWKMRLLWLSFRESLGIRENQVASLKAVIKSLKDRIEEMRYWIDIGRAYGWKSLLLSVTYHNASYIKWYQAHFPRKKDLDLLSKTVSLFKIRPVIHIFIHVTDPTSLFLRQSIESVQQQIYPEWQLHIVADSRDQWNLKQELEEFLITDSRIGIHLKEELEDFWKSKYFSDTAQSDCFILLGQNDRLSSEALYEILLFLQENPDAQLIYSDEDQINEKNFHFNPHFKPDWCPDSLLSQMYTGRLVVYRRSLLEKLQVSQFYNEQLEYDLILQATEQAKEITHLPVVLYHRRFIRYEKSEAISSLHVAMQDALTAALKRRQESATVQSVPEYPGQFIVRYEIKQSALVSIIIPTRDLSKILNDCLESVFQKSTYPNYEVIVIDNGSVEESTFKVFEYWKEQEPKRFKCYRYDIPYNFSKINNFAVEKAEGEYIVLLNNDTKVITPDWIEAMVEQCQRPEIGAVGALLLYPDTTVQHAGVVAGIGPVAGHSHRFLKSNQPGYFNWLRTVNNVSAVTAACLMCRRSVYEEVGGLEENLAVAYNDIDFCFKVLEKGYRNLYLPHAVLYHYESKTRGYDDKPEKLALYLKEAEYMRNKWRHIIDHDPCYSINLTRKFEDFSLNTDF